MECIDKEVNITNILFLEIFQQIFSYLNHYELAAVRLVCKHFNHASSYEFGRKSRLVIQPINLPELDNFVEKLSPHFQIRHVRILNLRINKSYDYFNCTNLANLPTTITDLEVVECAGLDEKILLQICARFTSLTTFSLINEFHDTEIDAAYIIAHLCERLKSLTLKIRHLSEQYLVVPVITTSAIESLTILHRLHNVLEFKGSKLYAVIAAISKGLKHLSLDCYLIYYRNVGEYEDDAVEILSELEWNQLQSLELLIEPKNNSSRALQKWIGKIGASLKELTLHAFFLDLKFVEQKFYIFEWVCDNCPQLIKFMFVCKFTEICNRCPEYDFSPKRLENLQKLTHLKVFKVPSLLKGSTTKPVNVETIQHLNSHLRHLEISFDPYCDENLLVADLEVLHGFRDLTMLKISISDFGEKPNGAFISQLFQHLTNLQKLSLDIDPYDDEPHFKPDLKNVVSIDIRNLKKLRSIDIRYDHPCMKSWLSFQQLSEMTGLNSIKFFFCKNISVSDIKRILQNCRHLTKIQFEDCKWTIGSKAVESQILAAIPSGRKCLIKFDRSIARFDY